MGICGVGHAHAAQDPGSLRRPDPYPYGVRVTDQRQRSGDEPTASPSPPDPHVAAIMLRGGCRRRAAEGASAMTDLRRPIPTFVHQRNRLTAGQQRAWDRWWPDLGHDVQALVDGTEPFDLAAWFGRSAPVVLEIGSGMGESTVAMAAAAPDVDHLAVEVFEPGLAQLLMRITDAGLSNIVAVRGDAVALLRERVPPGSLDGIRVFFPDPWPKRKHHKRRLVQRDFVRMAACRLRRGGTLHLATDWQDYAVQMRAVCAAEPMLDDTAGHDADGWSPRPEWRPITKFELRARVDGREIRDLIYRRNISPRSSDHAR